MKNPVIQLALNITKSEAQKRVILDWRTCDGTVGGSFDVTSLVLMVRDAFADNPVPAYSPMVEIPKCTLCGRSGHKHSCGVSAQC